MCVLQPVRSKARKPTYKHLQITDILDRYIRERQNKHEAANWVAALLRHCMLPFTRDTLITI